MKITLIFTGKTVKKYIEEGISEYEKRIKRYINFEIKVISELKNTKNLPVTVIKTKEGEILSTKITDDDFVILLDEKGQEFSSQEFAKFIENKTLTGIKNLVFVIGGAYGFSENIYKRANFKISLSKMTFSHQPVRILFTEQLYRAFTIIKGEPYHNE
jgi:23S rRNA (pseudouridine1915-N3)-methyltransferase